MGEQKWDLVISSRRGWFDIDLAGLWRYRDLVLLLFRRDFVALYKQTILGPLWYLLQPVLTTVVFTLIFSRIAKIPTDDVPPFVFYLAGTVLWTYFATCMTKTSDTFTANAGVFSKVYFPRLVVPVSVALSNLLTFAIQFALLIACMLVFSGAGALRVLGPGLLLVIPLLAYVALLALGVGMIISSLTTRYRDLAHLLGFATQLWMFATPIVYPLSAVPEQWHALYLLNPVAAPVETFRFVLFGVGTVSGELWWSSAAIAFVAVLLGLALFSRAEKTSMDTV